MKILSLNTWGNRLHQPLIEFIGKHSDADVFCFQEVWSSRSNKQQILDKGQVTNSLQEIASLLPEHIVYYSPFEDEGLAYDGSDPEDTAFGNAIFVMKKYSPECLCEEFVFLEKNSMKGIDARKLGRNIQHAKLKLGQRSLQLFNFHGLWNGGPKTDTSERLEQSGRVLKFMDKFSGPKILIGDYNLLPDTESFRMLSNGMTDLVAKYRIISTRSRHYDRSKPQFADYALLTKDLEVADFKVFPDEVSDHLALYIEIHE